MLRTRYIYLRDARKRHMHTHLYLSSTSPIRTFTSSRSLIRFSTGCSTYVGRVHVELLLFSGFASYVCVRPGPSMICLSVRTKCSLSLEAHTYGPDQRAFGHAFLARLPPYKARLGRRAPHTHIHLRATGQINLQSECEVPNLEQKHRTGFFHLRAWRPSRESLPWFSSSNPDCAYDRQSVDRRCSVRSAPTISRLRIREASPTNPTSPRETGRRTYGLGRKAEQCRHNIHRAA